MTALTLLFFYGLPDAEGRNPNWEAIGYPGPRAAPPAPDEAPKTIAIEEVAGESATPECDVDGPGVNPMVTIMSLAHRTAGQLLADD